MGTGNENIQPGPQEKNHNKTRHDQTNFKPKIEKREQANPTILSRARTSDNSDVYKQNKQGKQTLTRRSSQQDARPLRLKALFLKRERERERERERKIYGRKKLSILLRVASFSESIDCWFFCTRAFVHMWPASCAPRIESKSKRPRRRGAKSSKRTNERTNEYCAKRRRLKSTRPQSKSLRYVVGVNPIQIIYTALESLQMSALARPIILCTGLP